MENDDDDDDCDVMMNKQVKDAQMVGRMDPLNIEFESFFIQSSSLS